MKRIPESFAGQVLNSFTTISNESLLLIVVYARPRCKGKGGRPRLALVLREAAVGGSNPLGFLPKQVYTNNSPLVSKARNTGTLLWITARTSSFVAPASTTFATSTSNCPATG